MKPSLVETAARVVAFDAEASERPSPAARDATVAAMTHALRAKRRRRRLGWIAGGALVASAAAAAIVVAMRRPVEIAATPPTPLHGEAIALTLATVVEAEGSPVVVRGGAEEALAAGRTLRPSDRVVTPERSTATMTFFRGTRLVLDARSDLGLASSGLLFAFDLAAGAVRADVAKLRDGERFVVRTSDAEVEVRGTSFRVARAEPSATCGDGTTTRVTVYEGTVVVRSRGREALVGPGERWPIACDVSAAGSKPPPSPTRAEQRTVATEGVAVAAPRATSGPSRPSVEPPAPPLAPAASSAAAAATSPPEAASAATHAPSSDVPSSDLAIQNDLFARAIASKRAGDARGAVRQLDDLLARFPSTHLAQSARAERMKLMKGFDTEGARTAARDYLARYPGGFARSDAEIILGER